MKASIKDIARASGCSIATVSRTFTQKANVSDEVRRKIIETAKTLGYDPRLSVRRDCIAILTDCYGMLSFGPYETMLLPALGKQIAAKGMHMEIIPYSELEVFHGKFFRGVVSLLFQPEHLEALNTPALRRKTSLAAINSMTPGIPAACSNERQGVRISLEALAAKGHRRIGLAVPKESTWCQRERIKAYLEESAKLSLDCDESLVMKAEQPLDKIAEPILRLLKEKVSALLVADEELGVAVSYGLNLLGVKIPGEISVIGREFERVSKFCLPPQTTLCQDYNRLAERAVEMILEKEPGEDVKGESRIEFIDYLLIDRDSVGRRNPDGKISISI